MYSDDDDDDDDKKYTELLHNEIQLFKENIEIENNSNIIEIYDNFYSNNSPLSMSSNNSEISDEDNFDRLLERELAIEKQITDNFSTNHFSNELDMLVAYVRGHKKVYLYANYVMRSRYNFLTMTSILFTASISIFTPFVGSYQWSIGLIVILNALTTMMISIINQLQLEVSADIFYKTAMQYENIESSLEYKNNIIIFMDNELQKKNEIIGKISDIESELNKIKESDRIEIPTVIKHDFPLTMHLNMFSFIKKMHMVKKSLIDKFIKTKKEAKYIMRKQMYNRTSSPRESKRLQYLVNLKESIKTDLNHCINAYEYISDMITHEINIIDFHRYWYRWYRYGGNKQKKYNNPVVDEYIKFITQP
jgi:hypothetical protein